MCGSDINSLSKTPTGPNQTAPQVFISYARDNSHGERIASEIQQRLEDAGITVFRDVLGLKPGDVWYHKLQSELEASELMVVVVSKKVLESKWAPNEVSMDMAKPGFGVSRPSHHFLISCKTPSAV